MMRLLNAAAVLVLGACATATEVVPIGDGAFMVGSEGVIGNGSAASQLMKATAAANAYCSKDGKAPRVIDTVTMDTGFGRAPGATVKFRCT